MECHKCDISINNYPEDGTWHHFSRTFQKVISHYVINIRQILLLQTLLLSNESYLFLKFCCNQTIIVKIKFLTLKGLNVRFSCQTSYRNKWVFSCLFFYLLYIVRLVSTLLHIVIILAPALTVTYIFRDIKVRNGKNKGEKKYP
jgi:hypothetical protein